MARLDGEAEGGTLSLGECDRTTLSARGGDGARGSGLADCKGPGRGLSSLRYQAPLPPPSGDYGAHGAGSARIANRRPVVRPVVNPVISLPLALS